MGDEEPTVIEELQTTPEETTKETTIETTSGADGAGKETNEDTEVSPNPSDEEPKPELSKDEAAIIKIQNLQRQKQARKTFKEKRTIHKKKLAKQKEEKVLEDVWKVIESKADEEAIVKVQSIIRQKQAKKTFAQKRKEMNEIKQQKLIELAAKNGQVYPEGQVPKPVKKKLIQQLCTIM